MCAAPGRSLALQLEAARLGKRAACCTPDLLRGSAPTPSLAPDSAAITFRETYAACRFSCTASVIVWLLAVGDLQ